MWVRAGYSHAREGHTLLSFGHHGPSWQVPLLGGIAGARTYKVISTSRQEILPWNHWAAGKEEADCCGSGCICSSHPNEAKEPVHVGRRIVRQDEKHLERWIFGSLGSISIYFLGCNTTCRPQTRAGRCREKRILQPKGAGPSSQAPSWWMGWDGALHTPLDRHTPSCTVQTSPIQKKPVWTRPARKISQKTILEAKSCRSSRGARSGRYFPVCHRSELCASLRGAAPLPQPMSWGGWGRGCHRQALSSMPVTPIAVGERSQASGAICSGGIRWRRSKGNPVIFREVFPLRDHTHCRSQKHMQAWNFIFKNSFPGASM